MQLLPADSAENGPPPEALRSQLVDLLQARGLLPSCAVERAMRVVPRHVFLPHATVREAYADTAVPTRFQDGVAVSSASQPAIVALMLQQLRLEPGMRVLEIGTGTGYNAALLAEIIGPAGLVTTLDIDEEIVADARQHLAAAGYDRVRAVTADGAFGWAADSPYDRVILTVGAPDITPAWFAQVAEGGLLVLPLWLGGVEASVAFRKRDGALASESLTPCGFMRLRGEEAGPERWLPVPGGRTLFAERAAEIGPTISELLHCRPRRRIWTRPTTTLPQFLQFLGVRGYSVVALYASADKLHPSRRPRHRWGVFGIGEDGPSLALFGSLPMLLVFGGREAERILEREMKLWGVTGQAPIERTRVVARPVHLAADVPTPEGAVRILRRHFAYDITL